MAKKRVLVIDDEPDFIEIAKLKLQHTGYEILTAANGEEGLKTAKEQAPDIILLDICMPKLDGFGVLRKLKEDKRTRSIPVIMLTVRSECEDIDQATKLGADDYIVKPSDDLSVLDKINKLLREKESRQ